MAIIKSALELALERTKDVEVDKEGLEVQKFKETGMRLVAKLEQSPDFDPKAELAPYKGKELGWIKQGIRQVAVGYLNLPGSADAVEGLKKIAPLLVQVAQKPRDMGQMLEEVVGFLGQYLEQKEQLVQALRQQLEGSLRQKEDALYQQTGRRTRLTVDSDPEFAKYLTMNMDKLQKQYNQALDPIKEQVLAQLD